MADLYTFVPWGPKEQFDCDFCKRSWCLIKIPYNTVFLEFPDIEPTLKDLGVVPPEATPASQVKYTVPTIYHVPTKTYLMGSDQIAQFLESTYPTQPVPLTSELGTEIQRKAYATMSKVLRNSSVPRETHILPPRSQEFFRRTREASYGHRLEDLLDVDKEDEAWAAIADDMKAVGDLMQTNKADGPFILGPQLSYTDLFVAGSLQSTREIDEGVFQRCYKFPGFKDIYDACQPYMEKRT